MDKAEVGQSVKVMTGEGIRFAGARGLCGSHVEEERII